MEKLKLKKQVTTILFLVCIFVYSGFNFWKEYPELKEKILDFEFNSRMASQIASLENVIDENVYARYDFIDAYGYMQRLLGKNEESNFEVIKDNEGKLHYTFFTDEPNDTTEIAKRVHRLSEALEGIGTEVIYVLPPEKYIKGHTEFETGLPDAMTNEAADLFLEHLEEYDISYLDLRKELIESDLDLSEAFYKTDHHWKIETAFWAAGVFSDWMQTEKGEIMDKDGYYKDINNYNKLVYRESFLGSMGRKTGRYYAGVDDFALIYPKFETSYEYENSISEGLLFQGRFEEALLATPVIRQSETPFDTDLYMMYLYGNPAFSHIENKNQPDGLNLCFIKDSFAVPFAAFTSLRCQTIDMIDPRYYEEDYVKTLKNGNYDYVVIMVSPQDLVEEFFPYCDNTKDKK